MAYFYFDFKELDKQHRRNLLPSLLIQLSAQSRSCCDILFRLYSAHDNGAQQPSDGKMIRCLKDMLALPIPNPFTSSLTRSMSVQTGLEFHRLVNKFLRSSRSSLTSTFRIFIYASLADLNSIFELLLHLWHFTGFPCMKKADKRRTSSTMSIRSCILTRRR
jgi:hypothetical protein